jgi:hypothetical protein
MLYKAGGASLPAGGIARGTDIRSGRPGALQGLLNGRDGRFMRYRFSPVTGNRSGERGNKGRLPMDGDPRTVPAAQAAKTVRRNASPKQIEKP